MSRAPGALLITLALVGCEGASPSSSSAQSATTAASPTQVEASRRTAITAAVARVAPSVVTVQTEAVERVTDFYFGRTVERSRPGLGSGFIVNADGTILTNAHVVAGASRISVALPGGATYPARLIGADETNDLAVIKIDGQVLPVAPLGSSRDLLIGEWAIAIGNPFGFLLGNTEPSVTAGVVSGVGRNIAAGIGEGAGVYVDMIQTDASINPGNSGGPLINASGEVIGVNSSIFSPSGGSIGLGFAIPIDRAKRVMEDLLAHGVIRRPWDGINIRVVPPGTNPRDILSAGVVVRSVVPGSPADRAGVRTGDIILRAGDRALRNPYDWQAARLDFRVGEAVPLLIRRGGRESSVSLRITDLPELTAPRVAVLQEVQLVTLSQQIRESRRIRSASGALVVSISERMSSEIGLLQDDVLLQINNARIGSAEDAARAINYFAGRSVIEVWFERNGQLGHTYFRVR
ncbi:MAG: trypsin-like peptidase domain-containing protein [Gemmatimonadaceae bacterium]|nr:trypsin-like peptidase domain-containing protein [Gemmatimonadaceae bacterium]